MNTSGARPGSKIWAARAVFRPYYWLKGVAGRRLLTSLVAVFLLLLVVDLAVAWYYSDVLADDRVADNRRRGQLRPDRIAGR